MSRDRRNIMGGWNKEWEGKDRRRAKACLKGKVSMQ